MATYGHDQILLVINKLNVQQVVRKMKLKPEYFSTSAKMTNPLAQLNRH